MPSVSCFGGSAAIPVLQIIGVQSLVSQLCCPWQAGPGRWLGVTWLCEAGRAEGPAGELPSGRLGEVTVPTPASVSPFFLYFFPVVPLLSYCPPLHCSEGQLHSRVCRALRRQNSRSGPAFLRSTAWGVQGRVWGVGPAREQKAKRGKEVLQ